jgi:hypothetical protein
MQTRFIAPIDPPSSVDTSHQRVYLTEQYRDIPFSHRSAAAAPEAIVSLHALPHAPSDLELTAIYGDPVTDWLTITPTKKQRQYVKRDYARRVDHHYTVTVEEGAQ